MKKREIRKSGKGKKHSGEKSVTFDRYVKSQVTRKDGKLVTLGKLKETGSVDMVDMEKMDMKRSVYGCGIYEKIYILREYINEELFDSELKEAVILFGNSTLKGGYVEDSAGNKIYAARMSDDVFKYYDESGLFLWVLHDMVHQYLYEINGDIDILHGGLFEEVCGRVGLKEVYASDCSILSQSYEEGGLAQACFKKLFKAGFRLDYKLNEVSKDVILLDEGKFSRCENNFGSSYEGYLKKDNVNYKIDDYFSYFGNDGKEKYIFWVGDVDYNDIMPRWLDGFFADGKNEIKLGQLKANIMHLKKLYLFLFGSDCLCNFRSDFSDYLEDLRKKCDCCKYVEENINDVEEVVLSFAREGYSTDNFYWDVERYGKVMYTDSNRKSRSFEIKKEGSTEKRKFAEFWFNEKFKEINEKRLRSNCL